MKISATIITICLTLFLFCVSCSREEPAPPPVRKPKIRKPIKMPPPEKAKNAISAVEEKVKTEAKEGEEVKIAEIEEKSLKKPETEDREKETGKKIIGYYMVIRGDSLSSIAARENVYGDPLKWTILYRLNMDKLDKLQLGEGLPDREVPEGLLLRIILPNEIRENLKRIANNVWVVSVLSSTSDSDIVPAVIKLIRNGYAAYITRVKVKGKDWMRLRVGFFNNKADAEKEGKKIINIVNLRDAWITKAGKQELEEFGGYYYPD